MRNVLLLGIGFFLLSFVNDMNAQKQESQKQGDVFTFFIGSFEISMLSEGQRDGGTNILIDASPEILRKYVPNGTYPSATNAFLVKTPDKIVLIDAGYGTKLFDNLQSRDVTPEAVDVILITHMHGDHIGGLLKDGKAAFPNAEIYISKAEHDYWINDKVRGEQARAVVEAYKDRIRLFTPDEIEKGGTELFPGFRAVAAYGHTPGHTAYLLESKDSKLLVWGDLTHAMAVQMPHPEIAVTYDSDPKQAVVIRKKILDYVTANKMPIAGMHIAFPAVGNIKKEKDGKYTFEAF